jgi:hypothetical protein
LRAVALASWLKLGEFIGDTKLYLMLSSAAIFTIVSLMTHKYRGCIVVLSINKSVEPNEE